MPPRPDELPNAWLFQRLNDMEQLLREQHGRLRSDMAAGFDTVRKEMHEQQKFGDETRERVVIIETERRTEKDEVRRRSAWYGLAASVLINSIVEVIRRAVGGHT